MELWTEVRRTWPDKIIDWNLAGIRWRDMGAVEILWMTHRENIRTFSQGSNKGMMRQYLNAVGDHDMLAVWDAQSFNETDQSVGGVG